MEDPLVPVCATLRRLQCPLLEDAAGPWLREVLLQPSPHRTALLHWCCLQIEPALAARLPDPADSAAVRSALAGLGFCQPDSGLLAEPQTPARAAALWAPLLNVAALLRHERLHPVTVSAEQALLTELCRADATQEALRAPPELVPADIRQELPGVDPEPAELRRRVDCAAGQLAELQERLGRLQGGRPRAEDAQLAALRQLCSRTCGLLEDTRRRLEQLRPRLQRPPPARPGRLGRLLADSEEAYRRSCEAAQHAATVADAKAAPPPAPPSLGGGDNHKLVAELNRLAASLAI